MCTTGSTIGSIKSTEYEPRPPADAHTAAAATTPATVSTPATPPGSADWPPPPGAGARSPTTRTVGLRGVVAVVGDRLRHTDQPDHRLRQDCVAGRHSGRRAGQLIFGGQSAPNPDRRA